jgi:transposase
MDTPLSDHDLLHLDDRKASEIISAGPELVMWALLKLSAIARAQAASTQTPESTPSSQIPPYKKAPGKKKPRGRGRKPGHVGSRRDQAAKIDRHETHSLSCCPDCGGAVTPVRGKPRTRIVEDIAPTGPETTEHTIHSHYCPHCKKRVEPKITSAMPKAAIGNRALLLGAWLHYGLGQTISQIQALFNSLFEFQLSAGALTQQWARLGLVFKPWREQIGQDVRRGGVLHSDETGWRVNGKTHWLWCFTNPTASYYTIAPSRGSEVINNFLKDSFAGTLITDFFSAYNLVDAAKYQKCLAHLLRTIKELDKGNDDAQWNALRRTLVRLLKDALALGARTDRDAPDYLSKRTRIEVRMDSIINAPGAWEDADALRIVKRLQKFRAHLFTFLHEPDVPPDNNHAEREIRPAVIARKNSLHNTSDNGAELQALFLSIYRTLKRRRHDPLAEMAHALSAYIQTGQLPALPQAPATPAQPTPAQP